MAGAPMPQPWYQAMWSDMLQLDGTQETAGYPGAIVAQTASIIPWTGTLLPRCLCAWNITRDGDLHAFLVQQDGGHVQSKQVIQGKDMADGVHALSAAGKLLSFPKAALQSWQAALMAHHSVGIATISVAN